MNPSGRFLVDVPVRQCGVVCSDGLELFGLALDPRSSTEWQGALVFVPGQFDNAYEHRIGHALLESCAAIGIGCVLANTRGQDAYSQHRRYRPGSHGAVGEGFVWSVHGSALELVAEASRDLEAWTDFACETYPVERVFGVGHSHGAIKVANYVLDRGSVACLSGVALLSPSDDIGTQRKALGDRYVTALEVARQLIAEGRPTDAMPSWSHWAPMSAQTYVEAFGPHSPLSTFAFHAPASSRLAARGGWTARTLVVFAERDSATAGMTADEACDLLHSWFSSRDLLECTVIQGADHSYLGCENLVATTVAKWALDALCRTPRAAGKTCASDLRRSIG